MLLFCFLALGATVLSLLQAWRAGADVISGTQVESAFEILIDNVPARFLIWVALPPFAIWAALPAAPLAEWESAFLWGGGAAVVVFGALAFALSRQARVAARG